MVINELAADTMIQKHDIDIKLELLPLFEDSNKIRAAAVKTIEYEKGDPSKQAEASANFEYKNALYTHAVSWRYEDNTLLLTYAVVLSTPVADSYLVPVYDSTKSVKETDVAAHAVEHLALLALRDEKAKEEMGNTFCEALRKYVPAPASKLDDRLKELEEKHLAGKHDQKKHAVSKQSSRYSDIVRWWHVEGNSIPLINVTDRTSALVDLNQYKPAGDIEEDYLHGGELYVSTSYTQNEQAAIQAYANPEDSGVSYITNKFLRTGVLDEEYPLHYFGYGLDLQGVISNLDSAIAKNNVPEDTLVFRGTTSAAVNYGRGATAYVDKGFVSTSLKKTAARDFGNAAGADYSYEEGSSDSFPVIQIINVPKGTPALLKAGHENSEYELVLPRNGTFVVRDERKDGAGNYVQVVDFVANSSVTKHLAGKHNQLKHGRKTDDAYFTNELEDDDISQVLRWGGLRADIGSFAVRDIKKSEYYSEGIILRRAGRVKGIASVSTIPQRQMNILGDYENDLIWPSTNDEIRELQLLQTAGELAPTSVAIKFKDIPAGRYIRLRNFATAEKGWGRKMMTEIMKYAYARNSGLFLTAEKPARTFYEHLGFHDVTTDDGKLTTYYSMSPEEIEQQLYEKADYDYEPEDGAFSSVARWLEIEKHLPGQHNQRKHGRLDAAIDRAKQFVKQHKNEILLTAGAVGSVALLAGSVYALRNSKGLTLTKLDENRPLSNIGSLPAISEETKKYAEDYRKHYSRDIKGPVDHNKQALIVYGGKKGLLSRVLELSEGAQRLLKTEYWQSRGKYLDPGNHLVSAMDGQRPASLEWVPNMHETQAQLGNEVANLSKLAKEFGLKGFNIYTQLLEIGGKLTSFVLVTNPDRAKADGIESTEQELIVATEKEDGKTSHVTAEWFGYKKDGLEYPNDLFEKHLAGRHDQQAHAGKVLNKGNESSLDRYQYQDTHIEPLSKGMLNRDVGVALEGAGDILREMFIKERPNTSYIYEKLKRIRSITTTPYQFLAPLTDGDKELAVRAAELYKGFEMRTEAGRAARDLAVAIAQQNIRDTTARADDLWATFVVIKHLAGKHDQKRHGKKKLTAGQISKLAEELADEQISSDTWEVMLTDANGDLDTVEKAIDYNVTALQQMCDTHPMGIHMPDDALELFITDGKYKTIHEGGKGLGSSTADLRAFLERLEPGQEPSVYAHLDGPTSYFSEYGSAYIKLKDNVKDRAVVANADTYDSDVSISSLPNMRHVDVNAFTNLDMKMFVTMYQDGKSIVENPECIISGGVTLADVEEIDMPDDNWLSEESHSKLKEFGIKVRYRNAITNEYTDGVDKHLAGRHDQKRHAGQKDYPEYDWQIGNGTGPAKLSDAYKEYYDGSSSARKFTDENGQEYTTLATKPFNVHYEGTTSVNEAIAKFKEVLGIDVPLANLTYGSRDTIQQLYKDLSGLDNFYGVAFAESNPERPERNSIYLVHDPEVTRQFDASFIVHELAHIAFTTAYHSTKDYVAKMAKGAEQGNRMPSVYASMSPFEFVAESTVLYLADPTYTKEKFPECAAVVEFLVNKTWRQQLQTKSQPKLLYILYPYPSDAVLVYDNDEIIKHLPGRHDQGTHAGQRIVATTDFREGTTPLDVDEIDTSISNFFGLTTVADKRVSDYPLELEDAIEASRRSFISSVKTSLFTPKGIQRAIAYIEQMYDDQANEAGPSRRYEINKQRAATIGKLKSYNTLAEYINKESAVDHRILADVKRAVIDNFIKKPYPESDAYDPGSVSVLVRQSPSYTKVRRALDWLTTNLGVSFKKPRIALASDEDIEAMVYIKDAGGVPAILIAPDLAQTNDDFVSAALVHEYGHHLEASDPIAMRLANEFREATGRIVYERGVNNAADFAKMHAYSTRYYSSLPNTTEITSTGIQKLYEDPLNFLVQDPDFFFLTHSLMSGAYKLPYSVKSLSKSLIHLEAKMLKRQAQ